MDREMRDGSVRARTSSVQIRQPESLPGPWSPRSSRKMRRYPTSRSDRLSRPSCWIQMSIMCQGKLAICDHLRCDLGASTSWAQDGASTRTADGQWKQI
ncbi:hypothetical protein EJ03DRAFT_326969 [Teratosphaeria nubilosa]|uniref:Uncharacterized protein n=1 Tax=Teratosphaeria nubilosa TaxID=161662 RepID=A0A6G1LAB6_9PEZI|nr:hypothetical protein EJ03DRAFT_326969 [Teratosphaeria nubilosa]